MGRFRNGNFILDTNQKLKIDTTEITTDNSKLDVNNPLKVQSLELQSGPEITSISNNYLSDSTSELMTSKAVQDYIEDTLSNYSVGTDAVGSITQTKGDILGSQLFYGANNVEIDSDITNWGTNHFDISVNTDESFLDMCLLNNDVLCLFKSVKVGSYYHLNVSYYNIDGELKASNNFFESLNMTSSVSMYVSKDNKLFNGGVQFIAQIPPYNYRLVAINADGSKTITKEFVDISTGSWLHSYTLPNDDIVVVDTIDVNTPKMAVFRPDFDTTSFVTIQDFELITGDEFVGTYKCIYGEYFGNNKIVMYIYSVGISPTRRGIGMLDISRKEMVKIFIYEDTDAGYVMPDKRICVIASSSSTQEVSLQFIDENLTPIGNEKVFDNLGYYQGDVKAVITDEGKIATFFAGGVDAGNFVLTYALFDKYGNLEFNSPLTGVLGSNYSVTDTLLRSDSALVCVLRRQTSDPAKVYNFIPILTTDQINIGGTVIDSISSDPYNVSDSALLTSSAISTKASNIKKNVTSLLKPYMYGDRNLGLDLLDKYNASLYTRPYVTGATSGSGTITDEGYLALIYTTSTNVKADIINPLTAEQINSVTLSVPTASAMVTSKREALKLENGYVVSYIGRLLTNDSYLVAIDQAGNQIVDPYYSEYEIKSIVDLPNNEILVTRYGSSIIQINRMRLDIDSSSFISITGWQDTDLTNLTHTFSIGNNRYLHITTGDDMEISDINGNVIKSLNLSTAGVLTTGEIHYNKVTNLIYAVGYYSTSTNSRILTYNTDLELLDLYDLGGLALSSTTTVSPAVLPNGDFVFGFNVTSVAHYLVVIKPDGKIIVNESSIASSTGIWIYLILPDGKTIMALDQSIGVVFHYKEIKDRPGKNQKLYKDYASFGFYDFKIPEFKRKSITSSITPYGSAEISVVPFSTGRYALVYTKNVSPYRPVINIYDRDDELIVDTQDIFLGPNMSPTGYVSLTETLYANCDGFIDRNWIVLAFKNATSGQGCVVVYDDEGNQVCDPLELTSGTNLAVGALEGGRFYLHEFSATYNQGSGQYTQVWEVNSDTTSINIVQGPLRITSYINAVTKYSFLSEKRVAGIYSSSSGMGSWDTNNFGSRMLSGSFGATISARPTAVLPDNRAISLVLQGASAPYNIKSYTWQYDQNQDKMTNLGLNDDIFTSLSLFAGRSIARSNSGSAVVGVFNEYPLPSGSLYRYGIKLINALGEILNTDDLLNEQSTSAYNTMFTSVGFDGQIYTVLYRSSGTFLFDKWTPVIRKTSPLKYGHDVRIVTSSTGITLDKNYLDQRVTYNVAATTLNVTIPPNSSDPLSIGFRCSFSQLNSGTVTFVPGSGVTIVSPDSNTSLNGTGSLAEITKIDTNTWLLTGDLA